MRYKAGIIAYLGSSRYKSRIRFNSRMYIEYPFNGIIYNLPKSNRNTLMKKHIIFHAVWFFILLFATRVYAVTDAEVRNFEKSIGQEFENFFNVKYENINQMTSVMKEKELIYEGNLSKCTPGTYYFGYIDMFPIFVQAKIEGWKDGKCIENTIQYAAIKGPNSKSIKDHAMTSSCQYKPESIKDFINAPDAKKKSVRKEECRWYMDGKPLT